MPIYKSEPTKYERNRDKMLRYEYATYIMLGSYFKKSSISNKVIESKYRLNYAEISSTKQCDLEEIVIDVVDNVVIPKLSEIKDMENKEVILTPERIPNSELHNLRFHGEGFDFTISLKAVWNPQKRQEILYMNFIEKNIGK